MVHRNKIISVKLIFSFHFCFQNVGNNYTTFLWVIGLFRSVLLWDYFYQLFCQKSFQATAVKPLLLANNPPWLCNLSNFTALNKQRAILVTRIRKSLSDRCCGAVDNSFMFPPNKPCAVYTLILQSSYADNLRYIDTPQNNILFSFVLIYLLNTCYWKIKC